MDGLSLRQVTKSFEHTPGPVFATLDETVRRFGGRPAIDFLGKHWTWAEIGALVDRAAAGLQKIGVTKGVNVGLCLPNTPYFVIMYYAILKAGGTVVNFNPLYTGREIETYANDAGVSMMVSLDITMIHVKIGRLAANGTFKRVVVCSMTAILPGYKSLLFKLFRKNELADVPEGAPFVRFERLIGGRAKPSSVKIDPERDIAALQFTGGTTGFPKAAMLTHANLSSNVRQILDAAPELRDGEERILAILPFFHVFAMTGVLNLGTAIGAELVLLPRMNLKQLMATIFRCRPTILPGVPTLFTAISNAGGGVKDLSFIKLCISGGAPISAEAAGQFERMSGCEILEGYGLSETSPVLTMTPIGRAKRGSVGIALAGTEIEIRDPESPGTILPPGTPGEICVRGPQVMQSYYNNADETAAVFVDGAFRTGDIGYLDDEGYLFIVDRIKDLIICGGFNVYPRVIEEAAYLHPAVQDAIAIAIPDAYRGQVPKLFVTLRPRASASAEEILAFLRGHLNKIEVPRQVEIRDALPKTLVGKLSKKELVAEEALKSSDKS
jgi:long-chain acyl-CoA synthetase